MKEHIERVEQALAEFETESNRDQFLVDVRWLLDQVTKAGEIKPMLDTLTAHAVSDEGSRLSDELAHETTSGDIDICVPSDRPEEKTLPRADELTSSSTPRHQTINGCHECDWCTEGPDSRPWCGHPNGPMELVNAEVYDPDPPNYVHEDCPIAGKVLTWSKNRPGRDDVSGKE